MRRAKGFLRRFLSVASLNEHPRDALAVAAALFVAVFALRLIASTSADAVTFLYVVPIALVGVAFGERWGLVAGTLGFGLSVSWALLEDVDLTPLGYVTRAAIFLLIGAMVGRFAKRLRQLERESARHFNLSLDLVCIAGADGYFKHVNPSFQRILGYSEEELLSRPFTDFVHPDDVDKTGDEASAIADGRGTIQFQNRYFDKEGQIHWLEWNSTPLREENLIYAVARDVTERKALEAELERLSQHDPLTGLYNRRRFNEELERQLIYTRRYGKGGALLVLDLDRFKEINDELGHAAGDEALREVARVLRENLRASDVVARGSGPVVARLGGDEFVVMLAEVDAAGAQMAAERLVKAISECGLKIGDHAVRLEASIGVASFDDHGLPPAEDLLAAADRAMYEAKAAGGGTASVAVAAL